MQDRITTIKIFSLSGVENGFMVSRNTKSKSDRNYSSQINKYENRTNPENRGEKSVFAQSKAAISMSRISFIMLTTNECFKCIPRSVLEPLMEN